MERAAGVAVRTVALTVVLALSACGGQGDDVSDPGTEAAAAGGPSTTASPATSAPSLTADDIPVAHTPEGGWHGTMPAPVLAGCTQPLVDGAPELGGLWQIVEVESGGAVVPDHRALGKVQRIEQCGDRLVVTAGGIIHDMRVDGTEENGVHDVAEMDYATPITVVATYEDGVHVLRPVGLPVEVRRRRDGDQLVWDYLGFTARLDKIGDADADPGATIDELEATAPEAN
ncbi:MAG: hypothetical protein JNK12_10040 [Acidimicrobiales bacterium]|nr:hypothetical protein [Acidimicrobiales bacterium]